MPSLGSGCWSISRSWLTVTLYSPQVPNVPSFLGTATMGAACILAVGNFHQNVFCFQTIYFSLKPSFVLNGTEQGLKALTALEQRLAPLSTSMSRGTHFSDHKALDWAWLCCRGSNGQLNCEGTDPASLIGTLNWCVPSCHCVAQGIQESARRRCVIAFPGTVTGLRRKRPLTSRSLICRWLARVSTTWLRLCEQVHGGWFRAVQRLCVLVSYSVTWAFNVSKRKFSTQ